MISGLAICSLEAFKVSAPCRRTWRLLYKVSFFTFPREQNVNKSWVNKELTLVYGIFESSKKNPSHNFIIFFSVKYLAFYSCILCTALLARDVWRLRLTDGRTSDGTLVLEVVVQALTVAVIPLAIYIGLFYLHLSLLTKAGAHDNLMTSAFQASLEGGLSSIIKGQPLVVAHGSQVTLRHTHGRTCWIHSHEHVYPVRYSDGRGSSHQQQVSCYGYKVILTRQ